MALFSLVDHWEWTRRSRASAEPWMYSMISVDGVPG